MTIDIKIPRCGRHLYHHTIHRRWQSAGPIVPPDAPTITICFIQPDGTTKISVEAKVGESLLQTAHRNDLPLEGACEGTILFEYIQHNNNNNNNMCVISNNHQ